MNGDDVKSLNSELDRCYLTLFLFVKPAEVAYFLPNGGSIPRNYAVKPVSCKVKAMGIFAIIPMLPSHAVRKKIRVEQNSTPFAYENSYYVLLVE